MATLTLKQTEDEIRAAFEKNVREEIRRRGLNADTLAAELGVFPSTAMTLLHQDMWSLEVAIRIALGLGMRVDVSVGQRK